jgi:beta-ureidopropionase / N-carbamoyl-L-amino-acid hydrolase
MKVAFGLQINGDRLKRSLVQLAEIGKLPNGGVSRVAFTPEDLRARQQVQVWMLEAGMTVRIDAAGNIIGRYEGQEVGAPALATGSHIDTVAVGGAYDGCLGVLAGIEIVRVFYERDIRLSHAIEVIVFTDEERSMIGSKAIAGELDDNPEAYARLDGTPIETCLEKIGGNWAQIATAQRTARDIRAFLELHVEQGGVLEAAGVPIGIVDGVVGQYRFKVQVLGRANHAGTTPMHLRKDALVAAAQIILAVNTIVLETPGDPVGTVGFLEVSPNSTNTVPGAVNLSIDLRDLSQETLNGLVRRLEKTVVDIASATGTEITMQQTSQIRSTLAAFTAKINIEQVCIELGLKYMHLPSRAGHDAQEMGRFTEMGMIFVPSQAGISHSQDEYTSPAHCIQGTNVLLHAFLKLDEQS